MTVLKQAAASLDAGIVFLGACVFTAVAFCVVFGGLA